MTMLSIIIPCFNEEATLQEVLEKVDQITLPISKEIIVIDDCSTDNTPQIIAQNSARISKTHRQTVNQGKGAAISKGLELASGDIVIFQDADLEYDPNDFAKIIHPILDGKADVVYGSRFHNPDNQKGMYLRSYVANRFLTHISNLKTGLTLTDMETCYKAIKAPYYSKITIHEKRFGIEPEITAKLAKMNLRFQEISIQFSPRSYEEGKKITWRDGVSAIRCILKY